LKTPQPEKGKIGFRPYDIDLRKNKKALYFNTLDAIQNKKEEILDLLVILDELKDKKLMEQIAAARLEYAEGKSVPAERLFQKLEK